jgi:hypothetical protein
VRASVAYPVLWVIWIAAFFAIEMSALFTGHSQFSLSELTWRLERVHHGWTFARFLVAAFCLWLAGHLVWGLWK